MPSRALAQFAPQRLVVHESRQRRARRLDRGLDQQPGGTVEDGVLRAAIARADARRAAGRGLEVHDAEALEATVLGRHGRVQEDERALQQIDLLVLGDIAEEVHAPLAPGLFDLAQQAEVVLVPHAVAHDVVVQRRTILGDRQERRQAQMVALALLDLRDRQGVRAAVPRPSAKFARRGVVLGAHGVAHDHDALARQGARREARLDLVARVVRHAHEAVEPREGVDGARAVARLIEGRHAVGAVRRGDAGSRGQARRLRSQPRVRVVLGGMHEVDLARGPCRLRQRPSRRRPEPSRAHVQVVVRRQRHLPAPMRRQAGRVRPVLPRQQEARLEARDALFQGRHQPRRVAADAVEVGQAVGEEQDPHGLPARGA